MAPTSRLEKPSLTRIIDKHLGSWFHRADIPDELPSAFNEAEKAALKELQRRFPGLS